MIYQAPLSLEMCVPKGEDIEGNGLDAYRPVFFCVESTAQHSGVRFHTELPTRILTLNTLINCSVMGDVFWNMCL